mgnify:CR=1 FL=1
MNTSFVWEDFNHPKLKELRDKYLLKEVVAGRRDEYEKQLLLKKWVSTILPLGYNNFNQYSTAMEVLDDRSNLGGFNCSWYTLVYLQSAIALGWYARKIGIDTDHKFGEEEKRHTVIEIWSNKYNKWYVIDPMFSTNFEMDGTPLNAYEIRKSLTEENENIDTVIGLRDHSFPLSGFKEMHNTPNNYFWFFVLLRNNFLQDSNIYNSQALLFVDKYNKGKVWFVGGKDKGEFKKHPMYDGAFIQTSDLNRIYPTMGIS